jgi:hypothetical protein
MTAGGQPATRPAARTALGVVAVLVLLSGAIAIARVRDAAYPLREVDDQQLYLTSPKAAVRLSLEFKALAADLYWIRALQYYGGIQRAHNAGTAPALAAGRSEYDQLYPLLDLTTSFDPYFNLAYRFGAIFLSEAPPAGPGRPDLAIKLLEKGLASRPDKWEYLQDIGFVHYWWNHDYHAAARAFDRAAGLPGAPWWLRSLAATTLAQGGDRRSSRTMWLALRESAEIDFLRQSAERNLAQLDALDAIDQLQAIVNRHRQRTGETVISWAPLVKTGELRGIPADPAGIPFELTMLGRVQLSAQSPLFPLPKEPSPMVGTPPS